jgi:hypothetical protein
MDPIPIRLPQEIQDQIHAVATRMGLSKASVARMAITQWLEAAEYYGVNPVMRAGLLKNKQLPAVKEAPSRAPRRKPSKVPRSTET